LFCLICFIFLFLLHLFEEFTFSVLFVSFWELRGEERTRLWGWGEKGRGYLPFMGVFLRRGIVRVLSSDYVFLVESIIKEHCYLVRIICIRKRRIHKIREFA
jgi:hypothetical protein